MLAAWVLLVYVTAVAGGRSRAWSHGSKALGLDLPFSFLTSNDVGESISHERTRTEVLWARSPNQPVDHVLCMDYIAAGPWLKRARASHVAVAPIYQSSSENVLCFRAELTASVLSRWDRTLFSFLEPVPALLKADSSVHHALAYFLEPSSQSLQHPILADLKGNATVVLEIHMRAALTASDHARAASGWNTAVSQGHHAGLASLFPSASVKDDGLPTAQPSTSNMWRRFSGMRHASACPMASFRTSAHKRGVRAHVDTALVPQHCVLRMALHALAHPDVVRVALTRPMQLMNNNARPIVQSGSLHSEPYGAAGLNGTGIIVGVADTGIDEMSCYFRDMAGRVARSEAGKVTTDLSRRKVVQYITFSGSSGDYAAGHGSHVCGTIAGFCPASLDDSSSSHNNYKGMAPAAKLAFFDIGENVAQHYLDVPDDLGEDLYPPAYAAGARIHSDSWGGGVFLDSYAISTDAFHYERGDFLAFFAAGNSGAAGYSTVISPSVSKNCVSVGATGAAHANNQRIDYVASFSGNGPTVDGRLKPDVVAPGYVLFSADAQSENSDSTSCTVASKMGTSMATPVTAGNAALVREYFARPQFWATLCDRAHARCRMGSHSISGFMLKALVLHSGTPVAAYDGSSAGRGVIASHVPDVLQGYGRMQLSTLLPLQPFNASAFALYVDEASLPPFAQRVYEVEVTNVSQPLKVTVAWFDPPNDVFAARLLLHDLDLLVEGPYGDIVHGNAQHGASGQRDEVNPNEQVTIRTPQLGKYKVSVQAKALLEADLQSFALTITCACRVTEPTLPIALAWSDVQACPADTTGAQAELELAMWSRVDRNGWAAADFFSVSAASASLQPSAHTLSATRSAYGFASVCAAPGCYNVTLHTSTGTHRGTAVASADCDLFVAPLAPSQEVCVAAPTVFDAVRDDDNRTMTLFPSPRCAPRCRAGEHLDLRVRALEYSGAGWTSAYYAVMQPPATPHTGSGPPAFSVAQTLEWGQQADQHVCLPVPTAPTCFVVQLSFPAGLTQEFPELHFSNASALDAAGRPTRAACAHFLNTSIPQASLCVDPQAPSVGALTFFASTGAAAANVGQTAVNWADVWHQAGAGRHTGQCVVELEVRRSSAFFASSPFDGVDAACFADCVHFPETFQFDLNDTCAFLAETYGLCDSFAVAMGLCQPTIACLQDCSTETWCYYGAGMATSCPDAVAWKGRAASAHREVADSCVARMARAPQADTDGSDSSGALDSAGTGLLVTVLAVLLCVGGSLVAQYRASSPGARGQRLSAQSEDRAHQPALPNMDGLEPDGLVTAEEGRGATAGSRTVPRTARLFQSPFRRAAYEMVPAGAEDQSVHNPVLPGASTAEDADPPRRHVARLPMPPALVPTSVPAPVPEDLRADLLGSPMEGDLHGSPRAEHFTIAEDDDVDDDDDDHLRADKVTAVEMARAILFHNDLGDGTGESADEAAEV